MTAPVPLTATGTNEFDEQFGVERLRIEVHTAPGAGIDAVVGGTGQDPTHAVADGEGNASVVLAVPTSRIDGDADVMVSAMGTHPGQRGATIGVHVVRLPHLVRSSSADEYFCQPRSCAVRFGATQVLIGGVSDAQVQVDGATAMPTAGSPDLAVPIDLLARALTLAPADLFSSHEVERFSTITLDVVIAWPDGTRLEQPVGVPLRPLADAVGAELAGARSGPVTLATEGRGHAVLVVTDDPSYELHGDAATVGDIGLVAFFESATRNASCGRYQGPSGESFTLVRHMNDRRLVVIDRRTGHEVGRRVFRAPDMPCPEATSQASPESYPDVAETSAWLDEVARDGTVR